MKNDSIILIGVDEVGRGCLAGPVVAGAVVFDWTKENEIRKLKKHFIIRDSKKMSVSEREESALAIREMARVGIGEVAPVIIDEINILQATFLAMREAIGGLELNDVVAHVFVDGNQKVRGLSFDQTTVVQGDDKVFSIAAASIVAKVYRDTLMKKLHDEYPAYDWKTNKGYGTAVHREALKNIGVSPHHRLTFCKKVMAK